MLAILISMALLGAAGGAGAHTPDCTRALDRDLESSRPDVVLMAEAEDDKAQEARDRAEQARDRAEEAKERAAEAEDRMEELYQNAMDDLDEERYEKAIERFARYVERKGRRTDAAFYWQAYAQNKRGQRAEALATLQELVKAYPASRWLTDARSLETEVKQSNGQAPKPESVTNCDLKLQILDGLVGSAPDEALPTLEKFLQSSECPKLKSRALFVLCQSRSPKAREIVARLARDRSDPALQMKALKYLGLFGGSESRQVLSEVYAASTDIDAKRRILESFMLAGDRQRVLEAARNEKVPELRQSAIRQLGLMGAQDEIWDLYRSEPSVDIRKAMLQSMFLGGNSARLLEVAQTEKDVDLRRAAIRNLSLMGAKATDGLVSLYGKETEHSVKESILEGLFLQGNPRPLIEIARKESDPELRRRAINRITLFHTKESTDFLLEILNQ